MAYIDTTNDPKLPTFYNVTQSVGQGCPNMNEDVMMVQFFLERIYAAGKMGTTPKGKMKIDGVFGPITRNWVLKFQLDCLNAGKNVYPDAIVDSAKTGTMDSSITQTRYTIIYLNGYLMVDDPILYSSLPVNPNVPPKLRLAFAQMHAQNLNMNYV